MFFKSKKAASTTEMGLLVGLIAVGIILAVQGTGEEISKLFGVAENGIEGVAPVSKAPETPQPPAEPPLYAFTTHTFTNCGYTGKNGPPLSSCQGAYSTAWDQDSNFFSMSTNGFQVWTVPETANYRIVAVGAQGGRSTSINYAGGTGASASGVVNLSRGEKIVIVVGQAGNDSRSSKRAGGGGGGSFVWRQSSAAEPLVVGGGGSGANLAGVGDNGRLTTNGGNNGALSASETRRAGIGGVAGNGGQISRHNNYGGGAGGGYKGDGEARTASFGNSTSGIYGGIAGKGRSGGFIGGSGGTLNSSATGGFGGGGGGADDCGGSGAGGGYSGGGGASCYSVSGGGGSYVDSAATSVNIGAGSGTHGSVVITKQ